MTSAHHTRDLRHNIRKTIQLHVYTTVIKIKYEDQDAKKNLSSIKQKHSLHERQHSHIFTFLIEMEIIWNIYSFDTCKEDHSTLIILYLKITILIYHFEAIIFMWHIKLFQEQELTYQTIHITTQEAIILSSCLHRSCNLTTSKCKFQYLVRLDLGAWKLIFHASDLIFYMKAESKV